MGANKIERRDHVRELLGEAEAKLLRRPLAGETKASDGACRANDLEGRLQELSERIRGAATAAAHRGGSDPKDEFGEELPWLYAETPAERLKDLLQKHTLNERVIAYLRSELAAHVSLGLKLETMIRDTRDYLREQEDRLGATIEEMARKMEQMGLFAHAAQSLTKRELEHIVSYINNRKEAEGKEALRTLLAGKPAPNLEAEFAIYDLHRAASEAEVYVPRKLPTPEGIVPVVPDYEPNWPREDGDVPSEFWSQFHELIPDYRWEYREAETAEEIAISAMPLPPADSYENLRLYRRETFAFPDRPATALVVKRLAAAYLKGDLAVEESEIPEPMLKGWMFPLHGRRLEPALCDKFFGTDFFDGVSLPCTATGPGVIRTLRRRSGAADESATGTGGANEIRP